MPGDSPMCVPKFDKTAGLATNLELEPSSAPVYKAEQQGTLFGSHWRDVANVENYQEKCK